MSRLKKHPAMIGLLERAVEDELAAARQVLATRAQDINEHAVTALIVQPPDGFFEDPVIVQTHLPRSTGPLASALGEGHCERLATSHRICTSPSP